MIDFDLATLNETQRHLLKFVMSGRHTLVCPFLREHGSFFQPRPLPQGIRGGKFKACYANSYRLLKRHGKRLGLIYVEGYAVAGALGEHLHAWCVDQHGNVYDRTWNHGQAYFGVALKSAYVNREIQRRKASGDLYFGFLDDWEHGFPLVPQIADQPVVWKHEWALVEEST